MLNQATVPPLLLAGSGGALLLVVPTGPTKMVLSRSEDSQPLEMLCSLQMCKCVEPCGSQVLSRENLYCPEEADSVSFVISPFVLSRRNPSLIQDA